MTDAEPALAKPLISRNFLRRLLSSLVLAPLAVFCIYMGGWWFIAMIGAALTMAVYEWALLSQSTLRPYTNFFFGVFYITLTFCSFIFLRFGFEQGAWLSISALVAVWASDTGAYFTGKFIGGPKLLPKISPNKTWAGLVGAMFFCGLALMALAGVGRHLETVMNTDIGLEPRHVGGVFMVGLILGVAGQAGDLLVSLFKRQAGLKDTGAIIPGHGGLLDRIDSLMLVSLVFVVDVLIWMG